MLSSIWLWIAGSVATIFAVVRGIFMREIRINKEEATMLLDLIKEWGRIFIMQGEATDEKFPSTYDALCWLKGVPFRFTIEERMLRAGWASTDSIPRVTVFRWQANKLLTWARSRPKDIEKIPIYILGRWDAERVGQLTIPEDLSKPYMELADYISLENDVAKIATKKYPGMRTGTLLHGPPGNGKSYLVRYLALKYKLPIYIIILTPEYTNIDLVSMFRHLEGPAIALFEDFDNYFDKRKCTLQDSKFTFDAILNVLDGTYATLDNVIVTMTANDIQRIDEALKLRPGRLKHVLEVSNPSTEVRAQVFADRPDVEVLTHAHKGKNLDELLSIRDKLETPQPLCSKQKTVGG
jgi:hypothetical protein